jgi:iron complex outermembrane receptor protein
MDHFSRKPLSAAVAAILAGVSTQGLAQVLDEVIVTAERREMALQDTPISVMAFTGDTLEMKGVRDLYEVANITPNLDIKGARGVGNTGPTYMVRGIGGGGGATGERGVGFYIDNVFMPRTTGPVMRVIDVERIEVLRGPQGTLFGRNSTGGAIRVFTKQPGPEQDAYLKMTVGNFGHNDITGMVNVPINDQFSLRGQAAYLSQDGYVDRGPQDLGDSEDVLVRLQGQWNTSETVTATLGILYTQSESNGSPTDMFSFNMAPACPNDATNPTICWQGNFADWASDFLQTAGQPRLQHDDPRLVLDDYTMPSFCFLDGPDPDWEDACLQWNENDYTQVDLNVTWNIGDRVTMVATTGLSDFSSDGVSDWQLLGFEYRREQVESEVLYQEFQFNVELFDNKVDLVTGLTYFNEDSESPRNALISAWGSSTFGLAPPTYGAANGNLWGCFLENAFCATTPARTRVTGDSYTSQTSEAYGVFASATWHMLDRANLTLGARYSDDSKEFLNTLYTSDNFIAQTGGQTSVVGEDDWQKTDWRATVDFNLTEQLMMYVTASQAFRSGSFTAPPATCNTPNPPGTLCGSFHRRPQAAAVPPEELRNNELGMRSEWFDGRLRFNATYFDMDFTNRQGASAVTDPTAPTGFVIQLVNQGDVALDGWEVEAMFAITERLTVDASAGFVDYVMANPCVNNGIFIFPPPIDQSATYGARYLLPRDSGSNFEFSLSYTHVGAQETHPGGLTAQQFAQYGCPPAVTTPMWFTDSRYRMESYGLVNGLVRYTSDSGRWTASLYGNNLTDEVYGNNGQSFGRGFWTAGGPTTLVGINAVPRGAFADFRGRPREYGASFQFNFGGGGGGAD